MFPCSDWANTPIIENIPDSLGDIEGVRTQSIIVRDEIMPILLLILLTANVMEHSVCFHSTQCHQDVSLSLPRHTP